MGSEGGDGYTPLGSEIRPLRCNAYPLIVDGGLDAPQASSNSDW